MATLPAICSATLSHMRNYVLQAQAMVAPAIPPAMLIHTHPECVRYGQTGASAPIVLHPALDRGRGKPN
eukprot:1156892-Pelagomonas_calceolata.AAC.4